MLELTKPLIDGRDLAANKQSRRRRPAGLAIGAVVQQYKLEYIEPREIGLETVRILDRIVLTQWKSRRISGIGRAHVIDVRFRSHLARDARPE